MAPYYPVRFTPPPNDVYGITRTTLRQAVLRILSNASFDSTIDDDNNMANLSIPLILEALVPPPEDDPASLIEQFEALEDLQTFSFTKYNQVWNLARLQISKIHQLSEALLVVHQTASLAIPSQGEQQKHNVNDDAKKLTDLCRNVVAQIAVSMEQSSSTEAWDEFVQQPVRKLSARLNDDSSSSNSVAIAYMACLASSGGPKTLRFTLQAGLGQLLKSDDGSTVTDSTAVYGIGAFFSSCRIAMERITSSSGGNGIHIHPHPLQEYSAKAVDKICQLFETATTDQQIIRVAAVRAMESILLASPADQFEKRQIEQISHFLLSISTLLLVEGNQLNINDAKREDDDTGVSRDNVDHNNVSELMQASAKTTGAFLGRILNLADDGDNDDEAMILDDDENKASASTVIETQQLKSFLRNDVFATLLASGKILSKDKGSTTSSVPAPRLDRKTLAIASSFGPRAASRIVQPLAETLYKSLLDANEYETARATAETLSFLFCQSDQFAARAYQELASPSVTALDIMDAFAPPTSSDKGGGVEAGFGMSALQLPSTEEDRAEAEGKIGKAYIIIRLLRKGYEAGVNNDHFEQLVNNTDRVLPPLNSADTIRLSILLPFLSAAMESSTDVAGSPRAGGSSLHDTLRCMAPDLAEFVMDSENYPDVRSYAGRCLHASIARFTPRNAQECPAESLLQGKVVPALKASIKASRNDKVVRSPTI